MAYELISGLAYGVAGGVVYGLAGYAKASQTDGASFNLKDFSVTVVVSGLAGGIAVYTGQPLNLVVTGSEGVFLSILVKKIYDVIKSSFVKK